jgi:hypothetical protein
MSDFQEKELKMIVLSNGQREYNFYGDKKTIDDCFQRGFRVCLYQGN